MFGGVNIPSLAFMIHNFLGCNSHFYSHFYSNMPDLHCHNPSARPSFFRTRLNFISIWPWPNSITDIDLVPHPLQI